MVNRCRPFIFATAPSYLMAIAVRAAPSILHEESERQQHLAKLVTFTHRQLRKRGWQSPSGSQIVPCRPGNAGAFVKVWGIPLSMISQAKNLAFKKIKVYGGFQRALPLANPKQAALLVQGYISQAFGNWQGTDMSLDLIVSPGVPPA